MATSTERQLLRALKKLRDAIWNSDIGTTAGSRLNRAYIEADTLIRSIESKKDRLATQEGGR